MEEFNVKSYVPTLLSLSSVNLLERSHEIMNRRNERIANAYDVCFNEYWYGYIRKVRSNNWLKMHGYPMRRRGV